MNGGETIETESRGWSKQVLQLAITADILDSLAFVSAFIVMVGKQNLSIVRSDCSLGTFLLITEKLICLASLNECLVSQ